MTLLSFFGCLLVAYGPILSIFFLFIARNAQYVLLMVSSAFFSLIALLLSSVIWYFSKPIQTQHAITITISIAIQELCRWGFYTLFSRAETGLNAVSASPKSPFNRSTFAFVVGFGYAFINASTSYVPLLVESLGPGVIMCPSCPQATVFFISAITTSLFSLLHMAWMMIAFDGYSEWPRWRGIARIGWVVASHYGASFATLMNGSSAVRLGCVYAIVICIAILAASFYLIVSGLKARYRPSQRTA